MKVAVVGTGSIGKRHLKTLLTLVPKYDISELVCYDKSQERRDEVENKFNGVLVSNSLKETVLNSDIIFICVPTSLHIPVWKEIKGYGEFNYFIEKPLSHTFKDCDQIIFEQHRAKKHALVGYMMRLHPVLNKAKSLIDDGKIGRVLNVRAESGLYLPFFHPWEDYRDFYMSWKLGGGGALLDVSHEIDYLMWLFGDIKYAQGYSMHISDLEITTDDYTTCIFEFENGIMGELHLDLLQPEESRFLKVIGSKGVLIADLMKNTVKYNTVDDTKWLEEELDVDFDKIYLDEDSNVLNCILGKENRTTHIVEAAKVMQVIEAIRRSTSYGCRVRLPIYD